ncbi:hypothetical protein OUZ56_019595 [Daphnia magna]|uniref:Uncharacterized protein n=1 Tax=Daphnia magna TaxID=35525 RepID=A0ABQ9ZC14_9CRUS|nr:hypothetical protein OUZ56_019595 [Daphnia magna]
MLVKVYGAGVIFIAIILSYRLGFACSCFATRSEAFFSGSSEGWFTLYNLPNRRVVTLDLNVSSILTFIGNHNSVIRTNDLKLTNADFPDERLTFHIFTQV